MQWANNKYHTNKENEMTFWDYNVINKLIEIYVDLKCPNWNNKSLKLFVNQRDYQIHIY